MIKVFHWFLFYHYLVWDYILGSVATNLTTGQHQDVFLLLRARDLQFLVLYFLSITTHLGKPQFPPSQSGCLQFSLWEVEFPGNDAGYLLLPGNPVQSHLRAHIVIQRSMTVVLHHLLPAALPLPHRLQRPVPVQQLEDRHHLLELQHCLENMEIKHLKVPLMFCLPSPDSVGAWICTLRCQSLARSQFSFPGLVKLFCNYYCPHNSINLSGPRK